MNNFNSGLQSNSSSHNCPFCDAFHKTLEVKGNLRTIADIEHFTKLWEIVTGSRPARAKDYCKVLKYYIFGKKY